MHKLNLVAVRELFGNSMLLLSKIGFFTLFKDSILEFKKTFVRYNRMFAITEFVTTEFDCSYIMH